MTDRQVELIVYRGDELVERLSLSQGSLGFGRSEDSELCLADISVSRKHGRITVSADEVLFEDLGSGNGSWFKGQRVRSQILEHGDEILIEPFRLQIEICQELDLLTDAAIEGTDRTVMLNKADAELLLETDYPESRLEIVSGIVNQNILLLDGQLVSLGRSEQRDLVLSDKAASRLHCEIVPLKGSYWLRDSGSANGVQVNGSAVSEHELADGDVICIGETQIRFLSDDILGPKTDVLGLQGKSGGKEEEEEEEYSGGDHTEAFVNVISPNLGWGGEPNPVESNSPPPPIVDTDATIEPQDPNAPPIFAPLPETPAPDGQPVGFGQPDGGGIDYGLPPDLGDSPASDWAFGSGLENGAGGGLRAKKAPGSGIFGNWVRTLIVALLLASVSLVLYKKLDSAGVFKNQDNASKQKMWKGGDSDIAESSGDPDIDRRINALISEGEKSMDNKEYFKAFGKFHKVSKDDPTNESAQRLKLKACEYIAVTKLQEKVQANEATESEKEDALNAGISAADKALKNRAGVGGCNSALTLVRKGLKLNPENEDLLSRSKKLRSRIGALQKEKKTTTKEKIALEMQPLLGTGSRNLSAGRFTNAISDFQRALDADPDRTNIDLVQQAEEGLERAKNQRRSSARRHYADAAKFFNSSDSSDLRRARDFLKKAIAVDKSYTAASTKLETVMRKLRNRAKEEYDKGKVMLKASQYARARMHFQTVITLLDDPSERLYRRSKEEINKLPL
jgi:pSer/pThr/pTyr-binding forkhead associated (FHA) protein/tetratricopeptide (TPR) repeat protein